MAECENRGVCGFGSEEPLSWEVKVPKNQGIKLPNKKVGSMLVLGFF